jgi:hypothetical protein
MIESCTVSGFTVDARSLALTSLLMSLRTAISMAMNSLCGIIDNFNLEVVYNYY